MNGYLDPPHTAVTRVVTLALEEDLLPLGDLTSALLDPEATTTASMVAREKGVLAGAATVDETFRQVDPKIVVEWSKVDGDTIEPGDLIATISGHLAPVLTGERTALNFLSHLSGIASLTHRYVEAAAAGGSARIWDTRKTTPGLRSLEKAAVRAGGGRNHRGNLSDWMLVKDNHITSLGVRDAVQRCKDLWPGRSIHIECDTKEQMVDAIDAGATAVLLDNMEPSVVVDCVATARDMAGDRVLLEVSGGINLDTVSLYAGTGVDQISVGRMTNSAAVLDIGLDIGPAVK